MTNKKIGAGIISSFFVFLCVCTGCSGTANSANVAAPIKTASGDTLEPVQKSDPDSEDIELLFPGHEDATLIESENLTISITTSTTTPTSQSYTANFSSQITTYSGMKSSTSTNGNVYIALEEAVNLEELPSENDRLEALEEGEEDPGPELLTGYVYTITSDGTANPIIPAQYTYGSRATIDIISIGRSVIENDFVDTIESLYIPSSIETIDPAAFTNLEGKGVTFKLGFDEDEKLLFDVNEVFPEGNTVIFEGHGAEDRSQGIANTTPNSKSIDIIVGSELTYEGEGYQDDLRLGLQYDVYTKEGEYIETRITYFPVTSSNNFDGIGSNMGQTSLVLYFDIDIGEDEKINNESLTFFNLYYASSRIGENGGTTYYPDLNYPYTEADNSDEVLYYVGQMYSIPRLSYSIEDDISNYIDYSFHSLNTFSGYSSFVMDVVKADYDVYPELKKSSYQNNLSNIENGTLQVRYRLTSLNSAYYRIGFINEDGELDSIDLRVETPVSYSKLNTNKNNELSFIIHNKDIYKGFKVSDIRSVDIIGLRITIDLYNKSRNSIITKSNVETRFGIVNVMDYTDIAPSFTNLNLILILLFVGYTVVFLGATLGIYFYRKNKFKNDEFRRMNTRKFINQAIIAYIFIGLLIFFVATLLIRVMPLRNAVVTYNPIDPYLFFFAIGAIIAVGYYIRYFWLAGKAARHRKEVERLKLNEDEEDDGTGTDIN